MEMEKYSDNYEDEEEEDEKSCFSQAEILW